MGVEFIRRVAKSFKRSWDEARRQLGTADLFTREPSCVARSAPFEIANGAAVQAGDSVTVEKEGAALIARHRLMEVARTNCPPTDLLRAVEESCGVAKGTIEQVHNLAQVVEISLC